MVENLGIWKEKWEAVLICIYKSRGRLKHYSTMSLWRVHHQEVDWPWGHPRCLLCPATHTPCFCGHGVCHKSASGLQDQEPNCGRFHTLGAPHNNFWNGSGTGGAHCPNVKPWILRKAFCQSRLADTYHKVVQESRSNRQCNEDSGFLMQRLINRCNWRMLQAIISM